MMMMMMMMRLLSRSSTSSGPSTSRVSAVPYKSEEELLARVKGEGTAAPVYLDEKVRHLVVAVTPPPCATQHSEEEGTGWEREREWQGLMRHYESSAKFLFAGDPVEEKTEVEKEGNGPNGWLERVSLVYAVPHSRPMPPLAWKLLPHVIRMPQEVNDNQHHRLSWISKHISFRHDHVDALVVLTSDRTITTQELRRLVAAIDSSVGLFGSDNKDSKGLRMQILSRSAMKAVESGQWVGPAVTGVTCSKASADFGSDDEHNLECETDEIHACLVPPPKEDHEASAQAKAKSKGAKAEEQIEAHRTAAREAMKTLAALTPRSSSS